MAEHSGFQKLVAEAKKHITEISPQDAATKLNSGEAIIVVDVRDKDEWDEDHIPGATHLSRGTIELDIEEKVPDPNAMIIPDRTQRTATNRIRPFALLFPLPRVNDSKTLPKAFGKLSIALKVL